MIAMVTLSVGIIPTLFSTRGICSDLVETAGMDSAETNVAGLFSELAKDTICINPVKGNFGLILIDRSLHGFAENHVTSRIFDDLHSFMV